MSLIAREGLSKQEIYGLTEEEMMLYLSQAQFHRDKREIQRRMDQIVAKVTFDKKQAEKLQEQYTELERRDGLLDREFYGKY